MKDDTVPFQPRDGFRMPDDEVIRAERTAMLWRHRQLDDEIRALEAKGPAAQLVVRRLKKEKLRLKDRITALEDRIFPDIIA